MSLKTRSYSVVCKYRLWLQSRVPLTLTCASGGYNTTGTRVPFPLNDAFVLFTTGHPHWTG